MHENTPGHPESPARLQVIDQMLETHQHRDLFDWLPPRNATVEELAWVHTTGLISRVEASAEREHTDFDYETAGNNHSFAAASTAAGAAITAVDAVFDMPERPAYALVRPPGHHAERNQVMGFCLFNSVAVAAEYALRVRGCKRVLIYDWDVHHGNGTMHSFYDRKDVMYVSAHQFPHYPGTGTVAEIGTVEGAGYTINVPLPPGCGDAEYRYAMEEMILPVIRRYKPDLIIVSAGFDAHARDPLSSMLLSDETYGDMTTMLRAAADDVCDGRIVLALEGGYDLIALADANRCVLQALCGDWTTSTSSEPLVDHSVIRIIDRLKEILDISEGAI